MADTPRKKSRAAEPLNLETLMGNKPPQALDVEGLGCAGFLSGRIGHY